MTATWTIDGEEDVATYRTIWMATSMADLRNLHGRDGTGAPGGPSKARARRGERRTRRRAAAPLDLRTAQFGSLALRDAPGDARAAHRTLGMFSALHWRGLLVPKASGRSRDRFRGRSVLRREFV
jgi:hypothetical protein